MLLSIITVNLNNADGLERTARSIVEQTCQDYEWIVIDGGSTDGSVNIIKKYSDHIAYWVSEPDNGIYNAMNKGIEKAKGDYLQFLNSGDWYYNDTILTKIKSNLNNRKNIYYGDACIVNNQLKKEKIFSTPVKLNKLYFLNFNLCHQAIFYPKDAFSKEKYDTNYKVCADYLKNIILYFEGYSYIKITEIIVNYSTDGISSTNQTLTLSERDRCLIEAFPTSILLDEYHKTLSELYDLKNSCSSDIEVRVRDLIKTNKAIRYLLRLWIYPLHSIFISRKKENKR